jgi:tRNA (cmo5U34)-methyltransferase
MSEIWNASEYDQARRRLIPCYDLFYATAADLVAQTVKVPTPAILDLGAGTGLLSEFVMNRVETAYLALLDESPEMLAKAEVRLAKYKPTLFVQSLTQSLPEGIFHALVSALSIHHLPDKEKSSLFTRIYQSLAPGGVFVNAEQVLGPSEWHEHLYEESHFGGARALGSSEEEIRAAKERMSHDHCATLQDQVTWLRAIGFQRVDSFFQWSRFVVYAGWKPKN